MAIVKGEGKIGTSPRPARNVRPDEGSSHFVARAADHYRRQGRFDDAITLCLQALKARPTYVSARVVLGRTYLESGQHDKAEEEFHRVVELSPANVRARVHLGQICEAHGRTEDGIRHYEAALELVPLDREILASLLRLRRSSSRPGSSLSRSRTEDVAPLSADLPTSVSAEMEEDLFATETLADLYASQGLADRAAAIYQQLLDKEPSREGILAKLTALREKREVGAALQPAEASAAPAAHLSVASLPQSVTSPPPVFDLSAEPAAVAAPMWTSRQEILLDELERWLRRIRRYRKMAEARQ